MWKDDACLLEMLQAARDTTSFLEGRDEAGFYEDRVLHHAIMMLLVVIGENAHKISKDFQDTHYEIPWMASIGARQTPWPDIPGEKPKTKSDPLARPCRRHDRSRVAFTHPFDEFLVDIRPVSFVLADLLVQIVLEPTSLRDSSGLPTIPGLSYRLGIGSEGYALIWPLTKMPLDGSQSRLDLLDVLQLVGDRLRRVIPWAAAVKVSGGVPHGLPPDHASDVPEPRVSPVQTDHLIQLSIDPPFKILQRGDATCWPATLPPLRTDRLILGSVQHGGVILGSEQARLLVLGLSISFSTHRSDPDKKTEAVETQQPPITSELNTRAHLSVASLQRNCQRVRIPVRRPVEHLDQHSLRYFS